MWTSRSLHPAKLQKKLPKSNFGVYRDDELALLRKLNGQETDKFRKNVIRVFKELVLGSRLKLTSKKQIFPIFHLICEMELIDLTKSQMIGFFTFIVYQSTHQML